MVTYSFNTGDNVIYNSNIYTIFKLRIVSDSPAYFILNINDNSTLDNILESNLTSCDSNTLISTLWNNFNYTGDNKLASKFVMNNIVAKLNGVSNLEWGPNSDNSVYIFKASGQIWTKNKT